jgi:hypothetical protein
LEPASRSRDIASFSTDPRKNSPLRSFWFSILVAAQVFTGPALAQKLVDPNTVAPEYRAAAEKRRAEQIKLIECRKRADGAKVLPRDRVAHITRCLDGDGEK